MTRARLNNQQGFTILEITIAVLIISATAAFATPKIVNAMRSYRLQNGQQAIVDAIRRAKMEAVRENRTRGIAIDSANQQIGVVFYNDDGTVNRIEYRKLPYDVQLQRPSGSPTNPSGVSGTAVVSFGQISGVYRLDFNSRGMPVHTFGTTESVFLGNGRDYRALTISTVGGVRNYDLENGAWVDGSTRGSS